MIVTSAYTPITPTLSELKAYCRIDGSADDSLLQTLFAAAVEEFNAYTGYVLGTATVTVDTAGVEVYPLPYGPAGVITSVTTYDDEGNATVLALYDDYQRINEQLIFDQVADRVVIVYQAGTTSPSKDILLALYQRVKFAYDYGDDLPYNGTRFFDRLAFRYRQNF